MVLTSEIDEARHRVLIKADDVPVSQLMSHLIGLSKSRPDLSTYDFLCIFGELQGELTSEDLMTLKAVFHQPEQIGPAYTAVSNPGALIKHWSAALDLLIPGRIHRVFGSAEEAEAFLDRLQRP